MGNIGNFDDGDRKRKSSVRALLAEVRLLKKTTEEVLVKVKTGRDQMVNVTKENFGPLGNFPKGLSTNRDSFTCLQPV